MTEWLQGDERLPFGADKIRTPFDLCRSILTQKEGSAGHGPANVPLRVAAGAALRSAVFRRTKKPESLGDSGSDIFQSIGRLLDRCDVA